MQFPRYSLVTLQFYKDQTKEIISEKCWLLEGIKGGDLFNIRSCQLYVFTTLQPKLKECPKKNKKFQMK